jgi:hypothetical protein
VLVKTAAFILGLVGGVFATLFGILALAIGGIGNAFSSGSGNEIVGLAFSAMAAGAFAIICASVYFAGKFPGLMATGLAIAGIWHIISISYFGIVGGLLILLAALFAFLGRRTRGRLITLLCRRLFHCRGRALPIASR